jgi:serine kinase of HPr protein (carbohydrate metabolism regulator)
VTEGRTLHASAVLVGARALLVRGPSGTGKSRLAWSLIEAGLSGHLAFTRLVADDRVHTEAIDGRLLLRGPAQLQGLIEIRGLGIRRLPFEPLAVAGLIVDLAAADAARLPPVEAETAEIAGIRLPRLAVAPEAEALPIVLAALRTDAGQSPA